MNRSRSLAAVAILVGAAVTAACGDKNNIHEISAPTAGSAVKFFNFGLNAPAVNFYANDKKITATSTSACSSAVNGSSTDTTCLTTGKEATTGTGYGANASTFGVYYSVAPGSYTLSGHITAATDNGLAISNTSATLENGKFYSYYLSGVYNTTAKSVEGFVVEDPLPDVTFDKVYVRFVNASSNSQPMTLYAKDATGAETAIGSTVAYKSAGSFVALNPGVYDLNVRAAGSSTNLITSTAAGLSGGHVYTVTAYGDMTLSTGTNKAALDNTPNR